MRWGLWLARIVAFALLILLILAQRFSYTVVIEVPTAASAADLARGNYIDLGPGGDEVNLVCPTAFDFLGPDRAGLIDKTSRRVIELDLARKSFSAARAITLDPAVLIAGGVYEAGAYWLWVRDAAGDAHAILPFVADAAGTYQVDVRSLTGDGARAGGAREAAARRIAALGFPARALGAAASDAPRYAPTIAPVTRSNWSQSVVTSGGQSYAVQFAIADRRKLELTLIDPQNVSRKIVAKERYDIVSGRVMRADDTGDLFVRVVSVDPAPGALLVHEAIYKINAKGGKISVYDVPLEGSDCVPNQHVAISPAGDVYALRVLENRSSILKLGARSFWSRFYVPITSPGNRHPSLNRGFGLRQLFANTMPTSGYDYVRKVQKSETIDRRDVVRNACLYRNKVYKPRAANLAIPAAMCKCECKSNKNNCEPADPACATKSKWQAPAQLTNMTDKDVRGLPYNWGGRDFLDEFDNKIKDALRPAGHTCTPSLHGTTIPDENPSPLLAKSDSYAAGVDCSGFVTRAWGRPRSAIWTTRNLGCDEPNANVTECPTTRLAWRELRGGDIVNRSPKHVRLVMHWLSLNDCEGAPCPSDQMEVLESAWEFGGMSTQAYDLTELGDYDPREASFVVDPPQQPRGSSLTLADTTCQEQ